MTSRLEHLKTKVDQIYQLKHKERAEWADWLYAHHVFIVAEYASRLADRFGAQQELSVAAAMLHDIADAVMSRFDPRHEEESAKMARKLLQEAGFSDSECGVVVQDALAFHSCRDGKAPQSLEGKVMATADALVHLDTDFYQHAVESKKSQGISEEQIKAWALPKIERDFHDKILFKEVREEVRASYEGLRQRFIEM